jgi:hypothetical protein
MMGTSVRDVASLPPVMLDDLGPPNHFYRHLERTLDLALARDFVNEIPASKPTS